MDFVGRGLNQREGRSSFWPVLVLLVAMGCARAPDTKNADGLMQAGLEALYGRHDFPAAVESFRQVLKLNPSHYGATYQLAAALDWAGKPAEALPYWQKALTMANAYGDQPTAEAARKRLGVTRAPVTQESAMATGLEALYTKRNPQAAIAAFSQVLQLNPNHYGANYQLAVALEQAGRDTARAQWERVLQLAQTAGDQASVDTARAHLAATR